MFSLRAYHSQPAHTNKEVGVFQTVGDGTHVYREPLSSCSARTFQIYPANSKKFTFYSIPTDEYLFVFTRAKGTWNFEGKVKHADDYFYFQLLLDCVAVAIVLAGTKEEAMARLIKSNGPANEVSP